MTSNSNETLERIARRVLVPEPAYERILRRRDRKRRNQRIAAGVVGLALFVGAIGIVGAIGSLDREQTPAVTGGAGTGPTGSTDPQWNGQGLPPKGTPLSMPVEGELVAEYAEIHVGFVYVYADGRVIWRPDQGQTNEGRITQEGVDIARSGEEEPSAFMPPTSLPVGVWEASEVRPYVPARYAVCYLNGYNRVDPTTVDDLLPPPAEALLQGEEQTYDHSAGLGGEFPPETCFEVATDEARVLVEILTDAGFEESAEGSLNFMPPQGSGQSVSIHFDALLPHGEWVDWGA